MAILKKTQAYATFMGFQIQEIYALLFLVDTKYKDYKKIEIEVIDDVCIKGDNKIICQIKRKMAGNGKITNASEDLWKTIFNWMSFLKEYIVSDKDELMFVVECGPEISEEDYIYKMNSVSSDKESEDLYTSLKDWYTKKYVLVDNKAYVRKYLDEIFMEENKYYIKTIFIKFSLMINKENYFEKMKNIFKNDYVYPEVLIDGMVDKTISWFKQKIVECYPISVDRDEYSEVIRRYIEQHIIGAKLVSLKSNVNEEDIKKKKSENPLFLQELLKLKVEDSDIIEAIDYFIRTNENRQYYVLSNQIIDEDLYDFDQQLIFQWKIYRREVKLSNDGVLTKSNRLWINCSKDKFKLNNIDTPYFFTYGSYHILVDNEKIYWYLKELDK